MKSARVLKSAKLYSVSNSSFQLNNYNTSPIENHIDHNIERRASQLNPSGFIPCLLDSFISDGTKKLEILLPDTVDFSLHQSNGFSLFFWVNITKITAGVHRYILKRGNSFEEITPSLGFIPNGTTLFVKILTSKNKKETLYSSKTFDVNKWYNICTTFSIDYSDSSNVLTDISLYIDGLLDSQITVQGEPIHNQGVLHIGKVDNVNHGFLGKVVDVILIPKVMVDSEILYLFNACVENAEKEKVFMSYAIFDKKLERDNLIEKYAKYTNIPIPTIEKLNLSNDEMKEIVKKYDEELRLQNDSKFKKETSKEEKQIKSLKELAGNSNSENFQNIKNLSIHAKFINTAMFLSSNLSDELDVKRFLQILEIIGETVYINITEHNLIKSLCQILDTAFPVIKLSDFFKNLRETSNQVFQDLSHIVAGVNDLGGITSKNVELHENLLMNSQNFKYVDDFENELAAASITMRSLYSRTKSGRPQTTKGLFSPSNIIHNDEDLISQQFHNFEENKNHQDVIYEIDEEDTNKKSANSVNVQTQKKTASGTMKLSNIEEERKSEDTENKKKEEVIVDQQTLAEASKPELKEENKKNENEKKEENKEEIKKDSEIKEVKKEENKEEVKKVEIKEEQVKNEDIQGIPKSADDKGRTTIKSEISPLRQTPVHNTASISPKMQFDNNNLSTPLKEKEEQMMTNNNMISQENNESIINKIILDIEPKFEDDWSEGEFEIVILHCYDCYKHKSTTRHEEMTFVDKFNELGDEIKSIFSNIKIIGNHEKPDYLGSFDVYIRGVGTNLDPKGRLFLYRKIEKGKFPSKDDILDKLIALSMLYGSSKNLEIAQKQFLKNTEGQFPMNNKIVHVHPMDVPEMAQKIKEDKEKKNQKPPAIDPDRTKFFCSNWGCGHTFVQSGNNNKACKYHPGVWQFGSYHAYWPEAWSCCENSWNHEGCITGPHKGVRLEKRMYLCLNHGESNPKSKKPDSACGTYYSNITSGEVCKFHPGFINHKNNRWTCCDKDGEMLDGCTTASHKSADWPDEEAKLYFFPKPVNNPGLKLIVAGDKKPVSNNISKLLTNCDYFKPIQPYEKYGYKSELMRLKKEREKEEVRYCLNWACEKTYKDIDNHDKSCLYHPGKWDHGSTGTKMVEFIKEMRVDQKNITRKTILWPAHWTCCRKTWAEKGCKYGHHRGPILANINPEDHPYKWPDPRIKLFFPKVVTDKWKDFLKRYLYDEQKVFQFCKKFWDSNPKPMVSDLPPLCDLLRLYLLVVSDNVEYQLKFMDIVNENNSVAYFVENNFCNMKKFVKWWFEGYEKIIEDVYNSGHSLDTKK